MCNSSWIFILTPDKRKKTWVSSAEKVVITFPQKYFLNFKSAITTPTFAGPTVRQLITTALNPRLV